MSLNTVTWVSPDLSTWENQGKTTWYVNVSFVDGKAGSIGKQNEAKAKELQGLLTGLLGQEVEYGLEDLGKTTNKGAPKFKIKSFPGYEPEPYQGGGEKAPRDETGMAIGAAGHDAALLAAALIEPGESWTCEQVLDNYFTFVKAIYENNQSLRATTPPGAAAETGAGTSSAPAPTTSSEPQKRSGETTVSSGNGGGSDDWGAGAETPARGGGACSHKLWTAFAPDNATPLPTGYRRCTACDAVSDKKGVFK